MNTVLAVFFVLPFQVGSEAQGTDDHLSYDTFVGDDHNHTNVFGAAFFFAVQTLSSVGYGYVLLFSAIEIGYAWLHVCTSSGWIVFVILRIRC